MDQKGAQYGQQNVHDRKISNPIRMYSFSHFSKKIPILAQHPIYLL